MKRVSDSSFQTILGIGMVAALILSAVLLATSESNLDVADHSEVTLQADEIMLHAWSAEALLTQAQVANELVGLGIVENATALSDATAELGLAADQLDGALGAVDDSWSVADPIRNLGAGDALRAAIEDLGSNEAADVARDRLSALFTLAEAERDTRAIEIKLSADRAGEVVVASRWLVAVILPGLAILAIRRQQRRAAERLQLEHELETERAVRASKTQFVNAVLHHLRTPMSAVLGFTETLRSERQRFNARQRNEMIETIADQATDLGYLMEDLRVASRPDDQLIPIDVEDCDLRRSTETVLTGLEMQHSEYVRVTGHAEASADPKRLRQILRHLIGNARDHRACEVSIAIGARAPCVFVEVVDDGPGLPDEVWHGEQLGREVTSSGGDTAEDLRVGLGLRLSVRLAEQMGGRLDYERTDGRTTFRLTLPTAAGDPNVRAPLAPREVSTADIFGILESYDFDIVVQPIFAVADESFTDIIGFEALSRFRTGSPSQWLLAAERSGMVVDFELATIRKAVTEAANVTADAYLALNVSTDTLLSSELIEATRGIAPSKLVFELSEDATVANYERTCAAVEQLAERGYRLALDDVGTGEMDLWHVVRLSPHIVKLDMSLIEGIEQPDNLAIIESIIATATRIGATVVAEGIETDLQLQHVRRMGIEAVQGFYLGQPGRPDDPAFTEHLQRWSPDIRIDITEASEVSAPFRRD